MLSCSASSAATFPQQHMLPGTSLPATAVPGGQGGGTALPELTGHLRFVYFFLPGRNGEKLPESGLEGREASHCQLDSPGMEMLVLPSWKIREGPGDEATSITSTQCSPFNSQWDLQGCDGRIKYKKGSANRSGGKRRADQSQQTCTAVLIYQQYNRSSHRCMQQRSTWFTSQINHLSQHRMRAQITDVTQPRGAGCCYHPLSRNAQRTAGTSLSGWAAEVVGCCVSAYQQGYVSPQWEEPEMGMCSPEPLPCLAESCHA